MLDSPPLPIQNTSPRSSGRCSSVLFCSDLVATVAWMAAINVRMVSPSNKPLFVKLENRNNLRIINASNAEMLGEDT